VSNDRQLCARPPLNRHKKMRPQTPQPPPPPPRAPQRRLALGLAVLLRHRALLLESLQVQAGNRFVRLGHALGLLLGHRLRTALLVSRAPLLRPAQTQRLLLLKVQRARLARNERQELRASARASDTAPAWRGEREGARAVAADSGPSRQRALPPRALSLSPSPSPSPTPTLPSLRTRRRPWPGQIFESVKKHESVLTTIAANLRGEAARSRRKVSDASPPCPSSRGRAAQSASRAPRGDWHRDRSRERVRHCAVAARTRGRRAHRTPRPRPHLPLGRPDAQAMD
jgi:hypothetical protein